MTLFSSRICRLCPSLLVSTLVLVAWMGTGCSEAKRRERALDEARGYYQSGDFEKALRIYGTVLPARELDPVDFRNLGIMLFDRGSGVQALPYLAKATNSAPLDPDVAARLAALYRSAGRPEAARDFAWKALESRPAMDEPLLMVADLAESEPERDRVKRQIEQYRASGGDRALFHIAEASLSGVRTNLAELLAKFEQAVEVEPGSWKAHQALAGLLVLTNVARAEEEFRRSAQLAPPRTTAPLRYADFLNRTGRTNEAQEILQKVTEATPDYLLAWVSLAQAAFARQDLALCQRYLDEVKLRDPINLEAGLLRARLFLATGDAEGKPRIDEALNQLSQLEQLYPDHPFRLYYVALAQVQRSRLPGISADQERACLDAAAQALRRAQATGGTQLSEVNLLLAEVNLRLGNYSDTIAQVRRHLERAPADIRSRLMLADALSRCSTPASQIPAYRSEAVEIYRALADQDPTNFFQMRLQAGALLLSQTNMSEARAEFTKGLQAGGTNGLAFLFQLVSMDLAETNYPAAMQRIEPFKVLNPQSAAPLVLEARVRMAQKDYSAAIEVLEQAVDLQPGFESAYALLAEAHRERGDLTNALPLLEQRRKDQPGDLRNALTLAMAYGEAGRTEEAAVAYQEILKVRPDFMPALNNLSFLLSESGQAKRGLEVAEQANRLAGEDPVIKDTYGWALYRNGIYDRSRRLLEEAARSLPQNPEVQFHLGAVAYMFGDRTEARQHVESALRRVEEAGHGNVPWRGEAHALLDRVRVLDLLDDDTRATEELIGQLKPMVESEEGKRDPVVRWRWATLLERQGDYEAAATEYQAVLKLNPAIAEPLARLARLYVLRLGRADEGRQLIARARDLGSSNPLVNLISGQIALQTLDYGRAYTYLSDAARMAPQDSAINHHLGVAAYAMGRLDEASKAFREALALHADYPDANEANWYLKLIDGVSNPDRLEAMATDLDSVLRARPDFLPALYARARLIQLRGQTGPARQAYEAIREKYPEFRAASRDLGLLLADSESPDDLRLARELLGVLSRESGAGPEVTLGLGKACYGLGDFERAQVLLTPLRSSATNSPELLFYLGASKLARGDKASGLEDLKQALPGLSGRLAPLAAKARQLMDTASAP